MEKHEAKLTDIRKFLSTEGRPVSTAEFTEFWKSLTDDEKTEYKVQVARILTDE